VSRAALLATAALVALLGATFAVASAVAGRHPGAGPAPAPAAATPAPAPAGKPAAPARAQTGRELFAHTCGSCHALADAGASGQFGPDLDDARPSAARVRRMIRTGSLDGIMQPGLYRGREARTVAAYVARVAGRRP
jgi:mono/diheme cytochrome c family protein